MLVVEIEVIYRLLSRRFASDFTLERECLLTLLSSFSVTDGLLYRCHRLDGTIHIPVVGLGCIFVVVLLLVR